MSRPTLRQGGTAVLRLALGVILLAWVLKQAPLDELLEVGAQSLTRPAGWLAGIGFTLLGLMAAGLRWHLLLRAQGVDIPRRRALRLFFIGQFFNAFLPGSCGGDVARAYYIFRETQLKRAEAVSTVLVDRGIGLLTIIAFTCAMLAWRLPYWLGYPWAKAGAWIMFTLLGGAVLALVLFFHHNLFGDGHRFEHLSRRLPRLGPLLQRVYDAFYVYRDHPGIVFRAVLYSLANLIGLSLACQAFQHSIGSSASWTETLTLFPMITVLSALPITPGALGLREGLFVELFASVGLRAAEAIPLSLFVYLGGVLWSAVGGLLYITYRSRYGGSMRAEWRKLSDHDADTD